jgi:hypothetical protein
MKRFFLFAAIVCAAFVLWSGDLSFRAASAEEKSSGAPRDEPDAELARTIRQLTNRSDEGLISVTNKDGSVSVNLQGRYQNVMLARLEPNGEPTAACVTSLPEANAFFGKNLETGERVPQTQFQRESLESVAARHGMNAEEYLFYNRMIAETARREAASPGAATITIQNNDGAGEGFNDATPVPWNPLVGEGGNFATTLGAARLNVFNQAAAIWGAFLDSNVPITVRAQFDPQTCTATSATLGSASAIYVVRNFTGAQFTNTWYHAALTNKIVRTDTDPATPDITATFNSNLNGSLSCLGGTRFYFGFDNASPGDNINLLVVVLHEMGHGLGFQNFVDESTGVNTVLGFTDVFSQFTFDRTTGKYWSQMTDAERLASAINTGNVFWDGANVKIASGFLTGGRDAANGRVELYAPNPVSLGSSISHYGTSTSPNLLMEPFINTGLPLDLDLTRQQMRDIGWFRDTNTGDTTADSITNVTPNSGTVIIGNNAAISWTNVGNFSQNVTIELSTNGGATFPTTVASNIANTGSFNWTVPNLPTAQARLRVREDGFASPSGTSSANFIISNVITAATVSVSGRVSDARGRGISRATVTLTDPTGGVRTARANIFGYFRFADVPVGDGYVLSAVSKSYGFQPQVVNIHDSITGLNITANP